MPRPDQTDARPHRLRPLTRGAAVVAALLVGFVALAPSAFAWHPRVDASVACIDESIILDWTVWTWIGDGFPDEDFENPDIRVFAQYGTDDAEIGGLTDNQIGAGAFTDGQDSEFSGSATLTPPAGATRVRVHSDAYALWGSGAENLDHESQTTAWLTLPVDCTPDEPEEPVEVVVDATIAYDCEVSSTATVTVTSTGGPTTFVVRVDGVVVATLTDVEGTDSVGVTIDSDDLVDVVVAVDDEVILSEALDPTICPEVGGVVTQPTPPTTTPTSTPDPTVGSDTLPQTGAGTTALVAVALGLAGVGALLVAAARRPAEAEVRQG
jgi:LPXTG-motif cell wall-anchored protein